MSQADKIRQFAFDPSVVPARAGGLSVITIRAGDIHREMNLVKAMPAVCSAIGSNRFEQIAQARLINRTGPANGTNVYFKFGLAAYPLATEARSIHERDSGRVRPDQDWACARA
jgi:5-methylcytosine-specific restriction enzyme B